MSTDEGSVTMYSFLAGVFLTRMRISCCELAFLIEDFSIKMNCYICDNGNYFGLDEFFDFDENELVLNCRYGDSIYVNNSIFVFEKYLYKLTTDVVREYFDIPIKKDNEFLKIKNKNKTKVS